MISARHNRINIATDHILNDYSFFSNPDQYINQDNFYVYENGFYVLDAEAFIFDKLNELFPNNFKYYSHIRDVINNIQHLSPVIPYDQIDPLHLTTFLNGTFDKTLNNLFSHSPRFYTTKQIPNNYIIQENSSSITSSLKRLEMLNYVD